MKHLNKLTILLIALTMGTSLMAQNNCLEFDGTDDYVDLGINQTTLGTDFTISAWVYPETDGNHKGVGGAHGVSTDGIVFLQYEWGTWKCAIGTGTSFPHVNVDLPLSKWSHVSMVVDGSSKNIEVYLNGKLYGEATYPGETFDPYAYFWIGRAYDDEDRYFDGSIDEFRIWNDIRTEDEIRQNMYQEISSPGSDMIAYYKLNSTSGTTAVDEKSSYDGTLTNYGGQSNYWQTSPAMFGPKNALDFDGSNDYVSINNLYVSGSAFTVETWAYFISFNGSADSYITNLFRGGDENIVLRIGDGDKDNNMPQFVVKIGGTQYKLDANARLSTSTWYHLAGVYDGSEMRLYINGELDKSQSQSGTLTTTTNPLLLAGSTTDRFLDGSMDEVRIWSDARTASEIRDNMCKNLTGNETDLMSYYSCDNTSGTTLQDFSGNGYDGTLTNMDNADWIASSAFNTWLNTSSSAWSTTSNWSLGTKPALESVGIYSYTGGSAPTFTTGDEAGGGHVVVNMTSDWSIGGYFSVSGNLILESNINLNGQTIALGESAYLIEDAGRIYGTSGQIETTRSLSNISSENVAGLGAEITTAANMGSTVISRSHVADTDPVTIKRRFTITPTTNTGLNATLVFHYAPAELNGLDESTLDLLKSIDGGSNWTNEGGTVDNNANTITQVELDGFSDWTASGDATPILETSNPSQDYFSGTTAVIIASAATVTYSQNITAATVSITPVETGDVLSVSGLPGGLNSYWDNDTKILTITGTGSASDYQAALRLVKFETTSTTSGTRTIDFNLGEGIGLTIDGQKHFYEVIGDGVSSITWTNARSAALGSTYAGASGYLTTIMSEVENNYLKEKVTQDTWIGGSDAAAEGVWKWMDGPEAGTQFWSGGPASSGGHTVNGNYANWWTGEPNNWSSSEHYAHMRGTDLAPDQWGYWNDYADNNSSAKYYITEYGGDGTVFTTMDDATVEVKTDLTWDGSESSNWATSANWVQNVAPNASLNVVIPDVVIDPIIAYNGTASCNNLTVNSGATLTINSTSSGTGSLIVEGTASGNVIFKRYVDEASKAATWHYVSSPVAGQALNDSWMTSNSIVNTPPYQFFRWDEDTDYWIYYGYTGSVPEDFGDATFIDARGYAATRTAAGELSFTGTIRTSNVTYAATYTTGKGEGFNLVGNPFTSAIGITSSATSTQNFLAQNTALLDDSFEALYIWDEQTGYTGNRNDYKVISNGAIGSYTKLSNNYIQPGQAFMVKVVSDGGNLAFNENMQAHATDAYYKEQKETWPSVELIVENNDLYNSTAIGFNENMTPGLDPSYDVGKMKGNPDIALYTKLVEFSL